jgi:hypothetical protein
MMHFLKYHKHVSNKNHASRRSPQQNGGGSILLDLDSLTLFNSLCLFTLNDRIKSLVVIVFHIVPCLC